MNESHHTQLNAQLLVDILTRLCCSVLQCVAVCCSVLQRVAVCWSVLDHCHEP